MWDDAVVLNGRQTKWKYVTILIVLAALALGAAWALEHRQDFMYLGKGLSVQGGWCGSGCSPETEALALDDRLYLADDDTVTVLDEANHIVYSVETEPELRLSGGSIALAYAPLGEQVYILGQHGSQAVSVPGGVDAVAAGADCFAVITAGSGYLTRTDIYDYEGELLGRVGLKDSAMVRCAFAGRRIAALCYGTDGLWKLNYYTPEGSLSLEVPLEAEICFDLIPVGESLAVVTAEELLFLDENGQCTGRYLLGSGEIVSRDTAGGDFLALVLCSRGKYYLKTFSQTGELLGEAELPMEIRDLEVSGRNVCVLDFESLRVYDAFCRVQLVSGEGARTVSMTATEKGLWLMGNGEIMQLTS